jgi:hypothetical protein
VACSCECGDEPSGSGCTELAMRANKESEMDGACSTHGAKKRARRICVNI